MFSLTGSFNSSTATCILDNSTEHYLVIHPDTLVSGTTVSMATKCLRQGILNEQFRTESQNEAMLIGTLLHDLFDLAMEFKGKSCRILCSDFSKKMLQTHVCLFICICSF